MPPKLPKELIRVDYHLGFGWPECTRREMRKRTFEDIKDAASFVATLQSLPSHHVITRVSVGTVTWQDVPEAWLPIPAPTERRRGYDPDRDGD